MCINYVYIIYLCVCVYDIYYLYTYIYIFIHTKLITKHTCLMYSFIHTFTFLHRVQFTSAVSYNLLYSLEF